MQVGTEIGSKGRPARLFIFEGQVLNGADQTRSVANNQRWEIVGGVAEHLWMEDEKEVGTHQRQQVWEPLRRPGRSHKTTCSVAISFQGNAATQRRALEAGKLSIPIKFDVTIYTSELSRV